MHTHTESLLQDPDISEALPKTLDGLVLIGTLPGGTNSTFKLQDAQGRCYALKLGVSESHIKIEILLNVLYQRLNIPVISVQAYKSIPLELATQLGCKHNTRVVQLSEFIEASPCQNAEDLIINQAKKDFVIHAIMGNIDIAKPNNFIVTADGRIILSDAGSNFIHRSLGLLRNESTCIVSEIDSLRHATNNFSGARWFASLKEDEIIEQVRLLLTQQEIITKTMWEISSQLEFTSSLQDKLLSGFSHRLDYLAQRYGFTSEHCLKRDKAAIAGKTAAGVLHLQRIQGELCVLLSKRDDHVCCDNFGGKSENHDQTLARTAQRETQEESSGVLYYSNRTLAKAPFHDIISQKHGEQYLYRMYFVEDPKPIELNKLTDHEHISHHWVSLKSLQKSLQENIPVFVKDRRTINVQDLHNETLTIFPPFYDLLQQQSLQQRINILLNEKLKKKRTQSAINERIVYRPLPSSTIVRSEIALTLLQKQKVLNALKTPHAQIAPSDSVQNKLSQSELHLQVIMGETFSVNATIRENVTEFLKSHNKINFGQHQETFISQAVEMIQYEKDHPDEVFFYHGVNDEIAYSYMVYQSIYQILAANNKHHAFRTDNILFHTCSNIQEFIKHFQTKFRAFDNYSKGFMECALSTNIFLFGNHENPLSYTINYYIRNSSRTSCDLNAMLRCCLLPMGVDENTIANFIKLKNDFPYLSQGALYQISLHKDVVNEYAYTASSLGVLNSINTAEQSPTTAVTQLLHQLRENKLENTYEYVKSVQARIMVPPDAPISNKVYHLSESLIEHTKFVKALNELAEDAAFDMLKDLNPYKLNSRTNITRYLPKVYQQLQLSATTEQINDEFIIRLINDAAFEKIKEIIELYPEYKDKPLVHNEISYNSKFNFFNISSISKYNKTGTLLQRLLNAGCRIEIIYEIFGEHFYQDKLDSLPLIKIVEILPQEERFAFATQYQNRITSGLDLSFVIDALPKENKLTFATQNQNKITNGSDLSSVIGVLPKENKLTFATQHQNKIIGGFALSSVIDALPKENRLDFAIQHRNTIGKYRVYGNAILDLGLVLCSLPEENKLDFAIQNQDKIFNVHSLAYALDSLNIKHRLIFATINCRKIKNNHDLLYILEKLNKEDHSTFTNICKHANNVTDIRLIIGCCSLSIGICCALIAKNIYQLSTFLQNNIKGSSVVTAGLISIGGILIANSLFRNKPTYNYLSQDQASPGLVTV